MSFKDDPFNEVDNLVLAMLAYADFDGIVEDSFKTTSLSTADKEYFEKHSRADAKKSIFHFVRAPLLMDSMLKGERFRNEVMEREEYKRILPKVVSIVPDTSIIGVLLTSNVGHTIVKSKEVGLMQHDAFTWMIERNRFKKAEQSALGSFINSSQKEWRSNLDDE